MKNKPNRVNTEGEFFNMEILPARIYKINVNSNSSDAKKANYLKKNYLMHDGLLEIIYVQDSFMLHSHIVD
jgi:hypothetical protein